MCMHVQTHACPRKHTRMRQVHGIQWFTFTADPSATRELLALEEESPRSWTWLFQCGAFILLLLVVIRPLGSTKKRSRSPGHLASTPTPAHTCKHTHAHTCTHTHTRTLAHSCRRDQVLAPNASVDHAPCSSGPDTAMLIPCVRLCPHLPRFLAQQPDFIQYGKLRGAVGQGPTGSWGSTGQLQTSCAGACTCTRGRPEHPGPWLRPLI